jgi:hypothetical protein
MDTSTGDCCFSSLSCAGALVFLTDVYLMAIPIPVVLGILAVLFLEDTISVFLSHAILYRIDMRKSLMKM